MYVREGRSMDIPKMLHGPDFEMISVDDLGSEARYVAVYRRPGPTASDALISAQRSA